jgi:hypothetical protein
LVVKHGTPAAETMLVEPGGTSAAVPAMVVVVVMPMVPAVVVVVAMPAMAVVVPVTCDQYYS